MKKKIVWLFVSTWLSICHAANVLWDCVEMHPCTDVVLKEPAFYLSYDYDIDLQLPYHTFWVDLYVTCSRFGISTMLTADPDLVVLMFAGNWVRANPGDVAMESTTRHLSEYFMHCYTDNENPATSATSLTVTGEQDVYLMFTAASFGGEDLEERSPYYYGWVQLRVTPDDVSLVHSAINLDGDPIVVGVWDVPEPSSFLLLAAGGMLLSLRRRRFNAKRAKGRRHWANCISASSNRGL